MTGFLRPRVTSGFAPVAVHDQRPNPRTPAPDSTCPPGEDRGECEARRAREWAALAEVIAGRLGFSQNLVDRGR